MTPYTGTAALPRRLTDDTRPPVHQPPPEGPLTYPATCAHTHLFPGARCRVQGLPDARAFAAHPRPIEVDLRFSDGAGADAELRTDGESGPVLAVPAYTTRAGTAIGPRSWTVRDVHPSPDGAEAELILGDHALA